MTTEVIFGTCNHLFTNGKSKKPLYNLVKIYPEETKTDIVYLGNEDGIPATSTLIYGAEPPKRPPRQKKAKASQNGGDTDPEKLATQMSIEGNTLLCGCLPKSVKQKPCETKKV